MVTRVEKDFIAWSFCSPTLLLHPLPTIQSLVSKGLVGGILGSVLAMDVPVIHTLSAIGSHKTVEIFQIYRSLSANRGSLSKIIMTIANSGSIQGT
jgi:hypothetical protein